MNKDIEDIQDEMRLTSTDPTYTPRPEVVIIEVKGKLATMLRLIKVIVPSPEEYEIVITKGLHYAAADIAQFLLKQLNNHRE